MGPSTFKSSVRRDLFPIILATEAIQVKCEQEFLIADQLAVRHCRSEEDNRVPTEEAVRRKSLGSFNNSLEGFELGPIIGVGAVGRVRRVTYRSTGQHFALKCMSIAHIRERKQKVHTKQEKDVLLEVHHPFIVDLIGTFSDSENVYLLLSYIPGGELLRHLTKAPGQRFSTETARFYTASIVLALEYLHGQKIVYRDLKPENLLLDKDGYVKLCDFGLAKRLESDRTKTNCGTSEYVAPEVLEQSGHGMAVDWWSLGILLYEMLVGRSPFYDPRGPTFTYTRILSGKFEFPPNVDVWAQDLIRRLLRKEADRLGTQGATAVKNHPFFIGVDWDNLLSRKVRAPLKPTVAHDGDTSNFEDYRDQIRVGRADVKENDAWWTEGNSEVIDSTEIDLQREFHGF
eukprot:jgi/Botrbrau1/5690/Bobra.0071s0024.1